MYNSKNNKPTLAWKRYIYTCLFFISTSFAFADNLGFNFINDKKQTTIQFRLVGNLIVIPVKINKETKVDLVLDTGGRSLILFGKKFMKVLPVIPDKEVKINGYGDKDYVPAKLSLNNEVSIADILGKGIGVILADNSRYYPFDISSDIDGIIGYQIFSRFVVRIDYPNRLLTIYEPLHYKPIENGFESVPLFVKDTKPYIKGSLKMGDEIREGQFHIDTGSEREVILFQRESDSFFSTARLVRCFVGKGLNGKINGHKGKDVALGLANSTYKYVDSYFVKREFSDRELQSATGTIGSGFLKDFVVILDYVSQKFYFKKVA